MQYKWNQPIYQFLLHICQWSIDQETKVLKKIVIVNLCSKHNLYYFSLLNITSFLCLLLFPFYCIMDTEIMVKTVVVCLRNRTLFLATFEKKGRPDAGRKLTKNPI